MRTIDYLQKDTAEVRKLRREIDDNGKFNPHDLKAEIAINETVLNLYKLKFEEEGVPYTVKSMGNFYNINWRLVHFEKVDQIVENIGFELYEINYGN